MLVSKISLSRKRLYLLYTLIPLTTNLKETAQNINKTYKDSSNTFQRTPSYVGLIWNNSNTIEISHPNIWL
jgi:hypothetical protein